DGAYEDRLGALEKGRFSAEGLQKALQRNGYYDGAIDGKFGAGSRQALRRWTFAGCPTRRG
ncbi:MAG: peptidoglycan-binding domain-containing protein, partial [Pseudomonadota bacterium]